MSYLIIALLTIISILAADYIFMQIAQPVSEEGRTSIRKWAVIWPITIIIIVVLIIKDRNKHK